MDEFETVVRGVTCVCEVGFYYPGTNYPINAESAEPNDDPEFSFTLHDHKGNLIPWLNHALTAEDSERIFDEFLEHADEYKHDHAYH